MTDFDSDVEGMSPVELAAEVRKLRGAIRTHRDNAAHDLCWYVPELWSLLPDAKQGLPVVPPRDEFLNRCAAYRDSLQNQEGIRLGTLVVHKRTKRSGVVSSVQGTEIWVNQTGPYPAEDFDCLEIRNVSRP